jgi:tetratricopeptide (TPR) repeat protein
MITKCKRAFYSLIFLGFSLIMLFPISNSEKSYAQEKPKAVMGSNLFPGPEYEKEDKDLVSKLEVKQKKIAEKEKISLLESNIDKIKSPSLRARGLISLADLYARAGDETRAESNLIKAYTNYHSTGMGLLAADNLLTLYYSRGYFSKASEFATQVLTNKSLSPDQKVHFNCRAAEFLALNHDSSNAFLLVKTIAKENPDKINRIAKSFEEVSVTCLIQNDKASYYEGMKWINSNAQEYADGPRFLGNYAHACQVSGHVTEAIQARQRIHKDYPTDFRRTENLFELGNLLMENGSMDSAANCYRELISISDPDERLKTLQKIAQANLSSINSKLGFFQEDEDSKSKRARNKILWSVTGGGLILTGFALLALRMKRRRAS